MSFVNCCCQISLKQLQYKKKWISFLIKKRKRKHRKGDGLSCCPCQNDCTFCLHLKLVTLLVTLDLGCLSKKGQNADYIQKLFFVHRSILSQHLSILQDCSL